MIFHANKYQRDNMIWLTPILFGGGGVRLLYLWLHPMVTRDGITYINFCQNWFEQGNEALPSFLQTQPALLFYLGKLLMHWGIPAESSLLLINLVAGILLLIPVYMIGRLIFQAHPENALWLTGFAAVMPKLVEYSCSQLRESLYFLFFALVFCFWGYAVQRIYLKWNAFFCGLSILCAMQCRYESLELLIFCFATLPLILWKKHNFRTALIGITFISIGIVMGITFFRCLPDMPDFWIIYRNRIGI